MGGGREIQETLQYSFLIFLLNLQSYFSLEEYFIILILVHKQVGPVAFCLKETAWSFQIYKENWLLTNYCLLNFYVCGLSIANNSSLFHKSDMVYKIWQLWSIKKKTQTFVCGQKRRWKYIGSEGNIQTLWCIQKN